MRILLVKDDPQLGRATQIGLEQRGHAVDWVSEAQSALTSLAAHRYDCLLPDLGLPGRMACPSCASCALAAKDLIRTIHAVGYTIDRPAGGQAR